MTYQVFDGGSVWYCHGHRARDDEQSRAPRNGSNGMSSGGRLHVFYRDWTIHAWRWWSVWFDTRQRRAEMNQKERFARVMNGHFFSFRSSFRKFSSTDGIYICESDRIQLIFRRVREVAVSLAKLDLLFVKYPFFFIATFLWDSGDVSACLNRAM